MPSQPKTKLLLICMGCLIFIRFILWPFIDWQDEQVSQLQIQTQKLEKTTSMIARLPEFEALQQQQSNLLLQNLSGIPTMATTQQFRLEFMQGVQQVLEPLGVTVSLFDVVSEQIIAETSVTAAMVNLDLKGNLQQLAEAHQLLERHFPNLVVKQFRLGGGKIESRKEMTYSMLIKVYFKAGKGQ